MSSISAFRYGPLTATVGAALALAAAPSALAQPTTTEPSVTATGVGEVRPEPADRRSNDSIRAAVERARTAAIPKAVADARRRAVEYGVATGLRVGAVISVAEPSPGPWFYPGGQGSFGPGRFCGRVPRYRTQRSADGRIVRRTRIGMRRTCRVPSRVTVAVSVTYAASPAG